MSSRRTGAKDLRRKTATRPERRTIVIFCEGEASEPDYLNGLKRLPPVQRNSSINIEIDLDGGVPSALVKRAVARRCADDEVDEVWCVFDVEWPQNHPNLDAAVRLADKHGVRLAISNPCFELWLILHLAEHTSFLTSAEAERKSRKLDGRTGKRIDPAVYLPHRDIAAGRAKALAARHQGNRTAFPKDNPSSGFDQLLAAIQPENDAGV